MRVCTRNTRITLESGTGYFRKVFACQTPNFDVTKLQWHEANCRSYCLGYIKVQLCINEDRLKEPRTCINTLEIISFQDSSSVFIFINFDTKGQMWQKYRAQPHFSASHPRTIQNNGPILKLACMAYKSSYERGFHARFFQVKGY